MPDRSIAEFYFKKLSIARYILLCIVYFIIAFFSRWDIGYKYSIIAICTISLIQYFSEYFRRMIALYRNIPGIVITDESIYFYDLDIAFLWDDIKWCDANDTSLTLELYDAGAYIKRLKNPVKRAVEYIRFLFLKNRVFIFDLKVYTESVGKITQKLEEFDLVNTK